MATKLPRFSLTVPEEMLEEIWKYQADNKLSTLNKAIRALIEKGLKDMETEEIPKSELHSKYTTLDEHGKKMIDCVMDLEVERCTKKQKKTKVIPLFGSSFAAGHGEPATDEMWQDYTVDESTNADFAVKITGDSMEPELHDGQIALCVKKRPEIGQIAVFFVSGSFYVKQYITDGKNIYLRSVNRQRKDADLDIWETGNEDVICYGTVIHKQIPLVQQ